MEDIPFSRLLERIYIAEEHPMSYARFGTNDSDVYIWKSIPEVYYVSIRGNRGHPEEGINSYDCKTPEEYHKWESELLYVDYPEVGGYKGFIEIPRLLTYLDQIQEYGINVPAETIQRLKEEHIRREELIGEELCS